MATVNEIIAGLIHREGGYVNHCNDRGGPTKYGITQRTLSIWLKRPVSIDEVRFLTVEKAAGIYEQLYYNEPHIDLLPAGFQEQVFDMVVNHGAPNGVTYFQRFLNRFGSGLRADGIIGPKTASAATEIVNEFGEIEANNKLATYRKAVYENIYENDQTQKDFIGGWIARADGFIKINPEVA